MNLLLMTKIDVLFCFAANDKNRCIVLFKTLNSVSSYFVNCHIRIWIGRLVTYVPGLFGVELSHVPKILPRASRAKYPPSC